MTIHQLLVVILALVGTQTVFGQNDEDALRTYIEDGQLVIYTRSSYLSDDVASAITFIDFCPDGQYHLSYDGSYMVKGSDTPTNRDNRAYGAGKAADRGTWDVLEYQGAYYLEIVDSSGTKTYYPIIIQNLMSGRWSQGNTRYSFVAKKGNCKYFP